MTRVPALCDRCNTFFPGPLEFDNSTNIAFTNVSVGPCPRCGGSGHIPDGTYNFIDNAIEFLSGPSRSRSDLARLATILRAARDRGTSAEEVREQVRTEVPELASLTDILPQTRSELYAFIAVIVAILTLLLNENSSGHAPKIEINHIFNQITQTMPRPQKQVPRAEPVPHQEVGRNDLCPCGSGKKYKKCHMRAP